MSSVIHFTQLITISMSGLEFNFSWLAGGRKFQVVRPGFRSGEGVACL